jgi:hypothetical protein
MKKRREKLKKFSMVQYDCQGRLARPHFLNLHSTVPKRVVAHTNRGGDSPVWLWQVEYYLSILWRGELLDYLFTGTVPILTTTLFGTAIDAFTRRFILI